MTYKVCNDCGVRKLEEEFPFFSTVTKQARRGYCRVCYNEKARLSYKKAHHHIRKYKPDTINDIRYVDAENAKRVCGLSDSSLCRHALKGNIRAIKVPNKIRNWEYRYHIDDLQALAWPTTKDVATVAGADHKVFSAKISRYNIAGARKICNRYRFPPRIADMLVKWIRGGYPETAIAKRVK